MKRIPTRWRSVDRLPAGARARIARAYQRCGSSFVANYVTDDTGTPLSAPSTTITTKHQRAWVRPSSRGLERRMWTSREYARAMGFPDSYQLTGRVSDDCRLDEIARDHRATNLERELGRAALYMVCALRGIEVPNG